MQHSAMAARESYTGSLLHSTSRVPLAQKSTAPSIPFSYGTSSANFNPSIPIKDSANPFWDGDKKAENTQNLLLSQQAYALASSISYGGKSPVFDFSVLYLLLNSEQPLTIPC